MNRENCFYKTVLTFISIRYFCDSFELQETKLLDSSVIAKVASISFELDVFLAHFLDFSL